MIAANYITKFSLIFRLIIAIFGGYGFTSLFTAAVPLIALEWLQLSKTALFLWMMLFSFVLYSGLIVWIVATKRLLRAGVIIIGTCAALYATVIQLNPPVSPAVEEPRQ